MAALSKLNSLPGRSGSVIMVFLISEQGRIPGHVFDRDTVRFRPGYTQTVLDEDTCRNRVIFIDASIAYLCNQVAQSPARHFDFNLLAQFTFQQRARQR